MHCTSSQRARRILLGSFLWPLTCIVFMRRAGRGRTSSSSRRQYGCNKCTSFSSSSSTTTSLLSFAWLSVRRASGRPSSSPRRLYVYNKYSSTQNGHIFVTVRCESLKESMLALAGISARSITFVVTGGRANPSPHLAVYIIKAPSHKMVNISVTVRCESLK